MDTTVFDLVDTAHDLKEENLETSLMGRYKLGSKLAGGGFGVVFKAHQRLPVQREVAVKVLRAQVNATPIIARFEAERRELAMLDHPGVARVLDAGETVDGRLFFALERIDGVSITAYVRQSTPVMRERLRLFIAVCEAVHHAHQKGVIHRDLKPSNILVVIENGIARPKVIDFGLAKALEARALGKHVIYNLHDQIIGTPGYVSPEQVEKGGDVADVRGDVYALGALLYEMLTGVAVVDQKSLIGKPIDVALRAATEQPFVKPSTRDRALRGDLEAIMLKALAVDPALRYASAEALASDVQRHLDDWPVSARRPGSLYFMGKFVRRHRWVVALGSALLVAAAPMGWSALQKLRQQQRDHVLGVQQQAQTRHDSSRRSFQEARLLSERGQGSDAVAHLAYALREDPRSSNAATYLASLLSQSSLGHRSSVDLKVKPGWKHVRHVAVNSKHRVAVAVCGAEVGGRPDLIMRWNLDPGEGTENAVTELGLPAGLKISAAQTSVDDAFLILGFTDGSLARYDIGASAFFQFEGRLGAAVSALAISGDGKSVVASANKDTGAELRLWDVARAVPEAEARAITLPIEKFVTDEKAEVVILSHGRAISMVFPRSTDPVELPSGVSEGAIAALAIQPQGKLAALGLKNGRVLILSVAGHLALLGTPLLSTAPVTDVSFSADGQVLLTGDSSGVVMAWDPGEMRPLNAGVKLNGSIRLCRAIGDQPLTLAISERGELRLWHPDGQLIQARQSQNLVSLGAASQDGSLTIDVQGGDSALEVWELQARMLQPRAWNDPVPEVPGRLAVSAESSEGAEFTLKSAQRQFTGDFDRRVRVTEAGSGRQVGADLDHDAPVQHLALTPDGSMRITLTTDGTHRVWDALTGDPLMPPFRCGERATRVQPMPDGRSYLYRRDKGGWMQLPLPARISEAPAWFIDFAEARAARRLRPDGTTITIPRERQREIVVALPEADQSPLAKLARWLMKKPLERGDWPE